MAYTRRSPCCRRQSGASGEATTCGTSTTRFRAACAECRSGEQAASRYRTRRCRSSSAASRGWWATLVLSAIVIGVGRWTHGTDAASVFVAFGLVGLLCLLIGLLEALTLQWAALMSAAIAVAAELDLAQRGPLEHAGSCAGDRRRRRRGRVAAVAAGAADALRDGCWPRRCGSSSRVQAMNDPAQGDPFTVCGPPSDFGRGSEPGTGATASPAPVRH